MKSCKLFVPFFFLSIVFFVAGCGEKAGTQGDTNDPAATSDAEQMGEETGTTE